MVPSCPHSLLQIGARGGCAARPPKRDRFLETPATRPGGARAGPRRHTHARETNTTRAPHARQRDGRQMRRRRPRFPLLSPSLAPSVHAGKKARISAMFGTQKRDSAKLVDRRGEIPGALERAELVASRRCVHRRRAQAKGQPSSEKRFEKVGSSAAGNKLEPG